MTILENPTKHRILTSFSTTLDIQEIFGSHYELAELGPLGSNGMALQRDFESPMASFDIDESPWESEIFPAPHRNIADSHDPVVYKSDISFYSPGLCPLIADSTSGIAGSFTYASKITRHSMSSHGMESKHGTCTSPMHG